MPSPQEGHTRTGVSSGTSGGHSMAGIEALLHGATPLKQAGALTETLSHRRLARGRCR